VLWLSKLEKPGGKTAEEAGIEAACFHGDCVVGWCDASSSYQVFFNQSFLAFPVEIWSGKLFDFFLSPLAQVNSSHDSRNFPQNAQLSSQKDSDDDDDDSSFALGLRCFEIRFIPSCIIILIIENQGRARRHGDCAWNGR